MAFRDIIRRITNPVINRLPESIQGRVWNARFKADQKRMTKSNIQKPKTTQQMLDDLKYQVKDAESFGFGVDPAIKKQIEDIEKIIEGTNIINKKIATSAVVATQATKVNEPIVKQPTSAYRPMITGLKNKMLDQLQRHPFSATRSELIGKIEMMDDQLLSQLYYENQELFAIYWYGDSDEDVSSYDSEHYRYGYTDIIEAYESRFGVV